ncbi:hypothetical protein Bca4012_038004 [Brassica carinata]
MVRRTMVEHEAVFKTQLLELHRVYIHTYGLQKKDMIDELQRKQFNKEWGSTIEASCSSQATKDDLRKLKLPSFPFSNSVYERPSMSVVEDNGHSPIKGKQFARGHENGKPKIWPLQHQPLRIDHYTGTQKPPATPFLQPAKQLDSSSQSMQVFMNSSQRVMGLPNSGPPSKAAILLSRGTTSWQNLNFGFPQRVASAQRYPVDTLSGNAQKQGCLGDRLQFESNARYNNLGCANTIPSNHNMLYNKCLSSSKSKFSGTGYNYPNGGRSDYSLGNPFSESNGSEVKFVRDLKLKSVLKIEVLQVGVI